MSLVISFPYADRIELLTDGAQYLPSGRLMATARKVWVSPDCPMAVTGRGNARMVRQLAEAFIGFAAGGSFYEAMHEIEVRTDRWRMANAFRGQNFQMLIAGWSERAGLGQFLFQSVPGTGLYEGLEPMRISTLHGPFYAGPPMADDEATHIMTDDRVRNGAQDFGPDLCQLIRQKTDFGIDDPKKRQVHMVGGFIDHTVIDRIGATTRRMMTWPDRPCRKIDASLEPVIHPYPARPVLNIEQFAAAPAAA